MNTKTTYTINLIHSGTRYTVIDSESERLDVAEAMILKIIDGTQSWKFRVGPRQNTVVGETRIYYLSRKIIDKSVLYISQTTKSI
jgi:hypothetical protein